MNNVEISAKALKTYGELAQQEAWVATQWGVKL